MADINGVNGINGLLDQFGTSQKTTSNDDELGQAEFFELMVAQMKNQDPLKPESNGDFIAQLAQFRTSDGIADMQGSLESLTETMQSSQALQASALVGKSVLVPGGSANLKSDGAVSGLATLPATAQNVVVDIYSNAGALIKKLPIGTQPAGDIAFEWDGTDQSNNPMAPGNYQMVVTGSIGKEAMQFQTHVSANVNSVNLGTNGGEMKLNIDGVGQRSLSEIKQIGG